MPIESTLAIVKPDAFPRADEVVAVLKEGGFTIAEREVVSLDKGRASDFYKEHAERPFFADLVAFMSSGPVLCLVLRREDAVASLRAALGPTDPENARADAPASIRARFGSTVTRNAAHGSDSSTSAAREVSFFFPDHAPVHASGKSAKEWLNRTIAPDLTNALTEMCRLMPTDPALWLSEHLRSLSVSRNPPPEGKCSPAAPVVAAPSSAPVSDSASDSVPAASATPAKPKIYFVLGNAGAGKGSQCAKLVEKYGFAHLSAGDLLRAEVASGSELGAEIEVLIRDGKIVPGEVTINLLKAAIAEHQDKAGILVDGFPRKLAQAGAFEKDVSDFEFCLVFDCPEDELERRLVSRGATSGRSDDNIESIRKRFKTFKETCYPVIEYYEAKGKVHRIDATPSIDDVFEVVDSKFA